MGAMDEKIRIKCECIVYISCIPFTGVQSNFFSCSFCFCNKYLSMGYIPGAANPKAISDFFSSVTPEYKWPER